jgi:hypothetical protein
MDNDESPVIQRTHALTLIEGDRDALVDQLLRTWLGPSADEFYRLIERLKPRGKLNLVARNDEPPDAA